MNYLGALREINKESPLNLVEMANVLEDYGHHYGLTNEKRISAFLANFAHETDRLRSLQEYASGAAYEGRKDLGNVYAGDGKKFKGRGGFMITGRSNYKEISEHLFGNDTLLYHPELLENEAEAVTSSLYFWESRGLNQLADEGKFEQIVKRINGGLNGWKDRLNWLEKISIYIQNSNTRSVIAFLIIVTLTAIITRKIWI